MQQTAINPVYEFLGANPGDLPILNPAGPITGLLIQPLIGALSDRTGAPLGPPQAVLPHRRHRLRLCLFLFPFVTAVWMAVMLLWLLDASNNTAMEPYRAFIADKLPHPSSVRASGPAFFTGFGITIANISLFVFREADLRRHGGRYPVLGARVVHARCCLLNRFGASSQS